MSKSQQDLIIEEQRILDELIDELDQIMLRINKKFTYGSLQAKKAKEQCLPDTYGELIAANYDVREAYKEKKRLKRIRDELYDTRIIVDCTDEKSKETEEIKIGLHTYARKDKLYVVSWVRPVCRNYILDNCKEEFDGIVEKDGEIYETHFKLKLKRRVDMFFDKVKDVTHYYPLSDEGADDIIADEFLKELLSRRSEQEFRNIVFSIQKHQGEIIQTPFRQNMIVQGCAGSGKSMIMLHRLPILLYDNPNILRRSNLYIISPSTTYIQMAELLRLELEIDDLEMGTLNDYWEHVIKKYARPSDEYGKNISSEKVKDDVLSYVYSQRCINDIKTEISEILYENEIDCSLGCSIFHIEEKSERKGAPAGILLQRIVQAQGIINKNKNNLQLYLKEIKPLIEKLKDISRMLYSRKQALLRRVAQNISEEEKRIIEERKKLEKHDEAEHQRMYNRSRKLIELSNEYIMRMRTLEQNIEENKEYFEKLEAEASKIDKLLKAFGVDQESDVISEVSLYKIINNKNELWTTINNMVINLREIGNPYDLYVGNIWEEANAAIRLWKKARSVNEPVIPFDYYIELSNKILGLQYINNTLVSNIYSYMMNKIGGTKDKDNNYKILTCSPYLYLQVLYHVLGKPNSSYESLIAIDEAQNLSVQEFELIQNVNGKDLVLNLYGDVNQHVEGSKGIDSWNQIQELANFKIEYMRENYRNARQITMYCNNRFGMDMVPINLLGSGVRQFKIHEEFGDQLKMLLQEPMADGNSCIIVKNVEEAELILKHAGPLSKRINNITVKLHELVANKWNLLTIDQAKGLEFDTVFVLSKGMSKNEKYIAYTRALDKLIIHNKEIPPFEGEEPSEPTPNTATVVATVNNKPERKRRKRREEEKEGKEKAEESSDTQNTIIPLKDFLIQSGYEVVDMRPKKGCLWIAGTKEEIGNIVMEVTSRYGISGSFTQLSKALGYKPGWYTKSNK